MLSCDHCIFFFIFEMNIVTLKQTENSRICGQHCRWMKSCYSSSVDCIKILAVATNCRVLISLSTMLIIIDVTVGMTMTLSCPGVFFPFRLDFILLSSIKGA